MYEVYEGFCSEIMRHDLEMVGYQASFLEVPSIQLDRDIDCHYDDQEELHLRHRDLK
jgi:hypothetical protein